MTELIDAGAPVVTRTEIEITAPPEVVWGVLTAFDRWPSWNPEVKSMSAPDPLAVGSTFRWKAGPGTITSRIEHLEPTRLFDPAGLHRLEAGRPDQPLDFLASTVVAGRVEEDRRLR